MQFFFSSILLNIETQLICIILKVQWLCMQHSLYHFWKLLVLQNDTRHWLLTTRTSAIYVKNIIVFTQKQSNNTPSSKGPSMSRTPWYEIEHWRIIAICRWSELMPREIALMKRWLHFAVQTSAGSMYLSHCTLIRPTVCNNAIFNLCEWLASVLQEFVYSLQALSLKKKMLNWRMVSLLKWILWPLIEVIPCLYQCSIEVEETPTVARDIAVPETASQSSDIIEHYH